MQRVCGDTGAEARLGRRELCPVAPAVVVHAGSMNRRGCRDVSPLVTDGGVGGGSKWVEQQVFGPDPGPVEAEELFSASLIAEFVKKQGENLVLAGKWRRKDGEWHDDLTKTGKETIVQFVAERATAEDVGKWVTLLELVRQRLGLM
jgi:hypothetical protein